MCVRVGGEGQSVPTRNVRDPEQLRLLVVAGCFLLSEEATAPSFPRAARRVNPHIEQAQRCPSSEENDGKEHGFKLRMLWGWPGAVSPRPRPCMGPGRSAARVGASPHQSSCGAKESGTSLRAPRLVALGPTGATHCTPRPPPVSLNTHPPPPGIQMVPGCHPVPAGERPSGMPCWAAHLLGPGDGPGLDTMRALLSPWWPL